MLVKVSNGKSLKSLRCKMGLPTANCTSHKCGDSENDDVIDGVNEENKRMWI